MRKVAGMIAAGKILRVVIFGTLLAGCEVLENARESISSFVVNLIPTSVDEHLGRSAREQAVNGRRVLEDAAIQNEFKRMIAPLLRVASQEGDRFDIRIIDDPGLNAFALPGGFIYLHSGLIAQAESAEEVMGVLAHEMAHVTERHGMEDMLTRLGFTMVGNLIMQELGVIGDMLVQSGVQLTQLKFSRGQEAEADATGWDYLLAADLDPRGKIAFFNRLLPKTKTKDHLLEKMMRTHPATTDRIAAMQAKLLAWDGKAKAPNVNFPALQTKIRQWQSAIN